MLPQKILDQMPKETQNRLISGENLFVSFIFANYSDDKESFVYQLLPSDDYEHEWRNIGAYSCEISLRNNFNGYALTTILNLDCNAVSKIINHSKDTSPNEIHKKLLAVSDIFSFFLTDDLWPFLHTFENTVLVFINKLKNYVDFCNKKQIPYLGSFFDLLINNGYLGDYLPPLSPVSYEFDNLFDSNGDLYADLDEIYSVYMNEHHTPEKNTNSYTLEDPKRLLEHLAYISFYDITHRGKVIRKCQNCGKYFIPAKRSDTLYCDNPSPEAPEMTCKEYGTRRLWYKRQKEDELAKLSRNIASAKAMLAKRYPDIPQYADSYNYFKAQRLVWIKDIKDGRKTQDEYREWLLYMQSQKRIKEAGDGID